ncbi:MAG: amino acid kinase family protein [Gammaproteobacteria bacterium]
MNSFAFTMESRPQVVKLGGSLAATPFLRNWLALLAEWKDHGLVIVPGGGIFADQVRTSQQTWRFDDRTAHCMALLAMQQYGLMLASFDPVFCTARNLAEIHAVLAGRRVAVWLPDVDELDRGGIPSGWQVTSDSLSAWLAGQLAADQLILVKAAPQAIHPTSVKELARITMIDAAFPEIWSQSGVPLKILHASEYRSFADTMDESYCAKKIRPVTADSVPEETRIEF